MCNPEQQLVDALAIELAATNGMFLINDDAIEAMKCLPSNSVNLICVDLPYGTTQNKWDVIIPFDKLWEQFNRVAKKNAAMVFTAAQPFTTKLISSNMDNFKYDLIWQKTSPSGHLNVNKMPLRKHEHICVFYNAIPTYNEQTTVGKPSHLNMSKNNTEIIVAPNGGNYGQFNKTKTILSTTKRATSIVEVANPRIKNGHPTQKPVELMEYIIKTYSNKGDIVLDCCMGSGTTGVACKKLKRQFIGIELDTTYFKAAEKRINE